MKTEAEARLGGERKGGGKKSQRESLNSGVHQKKVEGV